MRTPMQGMFVLTGIALIVVGFNGSRPLVVVGAALIVLAVISSLRGRRETRT